ncbi:MAG: extracellular solute-binding protein [Ruminococcus sp.]|nr:extracellular solute-binding protein [Ruminococcus sp.]
MKNLKRILSGIIALTAMMTAAVSCSSSSGSSSSEDSSHYKEEDEVALDIDAEEVKGDTDVDISGTTITWLADYDINPSNNNDRSVALALFEDVYGGKIQFVQTSSDEKFSKLATMILSGDPVDMFPYEWDAVPNGVVKDQYEPLDDYFDIMGINDGLWDDMEDIIDMFEFNGKHYVVPYTLSDPLLITYSRKLMEAEGLDDPYELYEDGEWDWDVFMDMMNTFVSNAADGQTRYGINGWFGQAIVQSTGHTVINYDGTKFENNIDDPEIEKAELLMEEIASKHLYYPDWIGNFPDDESTLFFAMADWALGSSNAKNAEDADLMIVPFPKAPDADENYLCCNFGAKMLIKNSQNGEAVATYLKCERLAATQDEYKEAAKEKRLIVEKTAAGVTKSFITEEQYDALQSYLDPENITPMFDFGYGMGERMYGEGEYTYETRGVMNNLTSALLEGNEAVDSWATLRDSWTGVIDDEVAKFNGYLK